MCATGPPNEVSPSRSATPSTSSGEPLDDGTARDSKSSARQLPLPGIFLTGVGTAARRGGIPTVGGRLQDASSAAPGSAAYQLPGGFGAAGVVPARGAAGRLARATASSTDALAGLLPVPTTVTFRDGWYELFSVSTRGSAPSAGATRRTTSASNPGRAASTTIVRPQGKLGSSS